MCGDSHIERRLHAPYVSTGAPEPPAKLPAGTQQYANLGAEVLAKLVDHIMATTEDVGPAFPEEARKIHYGETDERRIRGVASAEEVRVLREEGKVRESTPILPPTVEARR